MSYSCLAKMQNLDLIKSNENQIQNLNIERKFKRKDIVNLINFKFTTLNLRNIKI